MILSYMARFFQTLWAFCRNDLQSKIIFQRKVCVFQIFLCQGAAVIFYFLHSNVICENSEVWPISASVTLQKTLRSKQKITERFIGCLTFICFHLLLKGSGSSQSLVTGWGPVTCPQCFHWSQVGTSQRWRCRKKVFWLALQGLWVKKSWFFAIVTGRCIGFIKMIGGSGIFFF